MFRGMLHDGEVPSIVQVQDWVWTREHSQALKLLR